MDRLAELKAEFPKHPFAAFIGATLEKLEEGLAIVNAAVRDDFLVTAGIVQGGLTMSVADFAGVYAAMSVIPTGHTPLSMLSGEYFSPFRPGEDIRAIARVAHEGKRSVTVLVEVFSELEEKALFTFRFAKPKP